MLDVRRMQVLRAVVSTGSITAAATNLGYTPSAVSQQVASLEKQAGLPLLERVGRGVRPTAAGRLLTEHATRLAEQLAEAESALTALRNGCAGTLRVRYFATAGAALVPPAVATFRAERSGVELDLKLTEPTDPFEELAAGRADVAITLLEPSEPTPEGVVARHLLADPFYAVLPRGHALARKRVLDLCELADEPWVSADCGASGLCKDVVPRACAGAGFAPQVAVESDDYATAQGFVAAGLGVALIPRLGLGYAHPGVVLRKVRNPEPVRHIHVVYREDAAWNPAVVSLAEALEKAARAS
ncbi:ModE molybdate transport repressor domain-containing protein [Lentzea xinjiangensis]|uniref:ModE molybdate transport repressor domain-containing protein n=1 Tax=Lentzea xinjiangensis TaxID=402600 RepID=A0A1H9BNN4_9PSEU|nr:LysR family transcriptional regulator [Lentzea xinjiangensis]SEP90552.1 ModE molybdate transport repressor domain-containing protein [Lentzea xinjiangensis]